VNPYALLVGGIAFLAAVGGAGWQGYRMGRDAEIAAQAREDRAVQAALKVTAEAIAAIEVKHVTIKQRAETEIREVPVYRDCRNTDVGLQLINAALTGTEPARGGLVPGTPAADRSDVRGDRSEADRGRDSVP
jgi:hypothetical protein